MHRFVSNRVKAAMALGLVLGVFVQLIHASVPAIYGIALVAGAVLLWFDLGPIEGNPISRWIRR